MKWEPGRVAQERRAKSTLNAMIWLLIGVMIGLVLGALQ
jgi:hypothetical protein